MKVEILTDLYDSDEQELLVPKGVVLELDPKFNPEDYAGLLEDDAIVVTYQGALVTIFAGEYKIFKEKKLQLIAKRIRQTLGRPLDRFLAPKIGGKRWDT